MKLAPWVGLALFVPLYLAAYFAFQFNGTILIFLLFLMQGFLCFFANHWAPFLVLCAVFYVFPNPTSSNIVVPMALGLAGILTGVGVLAPMPESAFGASRVSFAAVLLLMIGFATALPAAYAGERLDQTVLQAFRLAVLFGALPILCARWICLQQVRSCIFMIAVGMVAYYALLVFTLSGNLEMSSGRIDSVQGQLRIGARSLELSRTHTGPTLAIACCVLWGLLLTERRFVYKAAILAMWAFGTIAVMYTGARGALGVEALVCFGIMCLVAWRTHRLGATVVICLLCSGMAVGAWVFLPQAFSVVGLRLQEMPDAIGGYDRLDRWLWSFEFFVNNPMGVGWTLTPIGIESHAHNDLLIMAMSFGFVGATAFIVAFGVELRFFLRNLMAPGSEAFDTCLPSFACLAALAACGATDMVLAIGWIFDVSWLMVLLARASLPDDGAAQ